MSIFVVSRENPKVCTENELKKFTQLVNTTVASKRLLFREIYESCGRKYHCIKEYGSDYVNVILVKIEDACKINNR